MARALTRAEAKKREQDKPWQPNAGPQSRFLAASAFECLYGGAAGGGKSEALLMGALRFIHEPSYRALIVRRSYPELESSVIDRSMGLYTRIVTRKHYNSGHKTWTFPSGAQIRFASVESDALVSKFQGAEYQYIGVDELTTFTEFQYRYLISRLRSSAGVPMRLRAATNPGGIGHDWVLRRFAPWLYPAGHREYKGLRAQPEQRLYARLVEDDDGQVREEYCDRYAHNEACAAGLLPNPDDAPLCRPGAPCEEHAPLARAFFPAKVTDNPKVDRGYRARLDMLDALSRARLKHGDWMAAAAAGLFFKREWLPIVDRIVGNVIARVRYWDRAGGENPGSDWTAGLMLVLTDAGIWYVEDVKHFQGSPAMVEARIRSTAAEDAAKYPTGLGAVHLFLERDPAQAGKYEVASYMKVLAAFAPHFVAPIGDKVSRAQPASAQAEQGFMRLLRGDWNEAFILELVGFPEGHDDQVDALSGAFGRCLRLVAQAGEIGATVVTGEDEDGGGEDEDEPQVLPEDYD